MISESQSTICTINEGSNKIAKSQPFPIAKGASALISKQSDAQGAPNHSYQ